MYCLFIVTGTNEHSTILGAAGSGAGRQANGAGPGHVSNPVTVCFQLLLFLPLAILLLLPQFDEVVTAA